MAVLPNRQNAGSTNKRIAVELLGAVIDVALAAGAGTAGTWRLDM